MNNDGWLDIVVGNHESQNQLLLNDCTGYFVVEDTLDLPCSSLYTTSSVAVGDVNNDQ